jgi:predicted DNA-binding transcriptional regulator YafY
MPRPVAFPPRADRLELVARVLRDRPGVTAAELARELGVSERSIFRDLDALRERGYPIEASRGRGGGLRLHANWGLGRVLLSRDEALCTLLALAVSERLGFPMFSAEIARARRRIADAFPTGERRRIAPLRERIFVGAPASAAVRASYRNPAPAPLRQLQEAFVEERVVRAAYAREDGTRTERLLEPHVLLIDWPAWYLVAHDRDRNAPRTFRLDRFVSVAAEAETFRPRAREMIDAALSGSGVAVERV